MKVGKILVVLTVTIFKFYFLIVEFLNRCIEQSVTYLETFYVDEGWFLNYKKSTFYFEKYAFLQSLTIKKEKQKKKKKNSF